MKKPVSIRETDRGVAGPARRRPRARSPLALLIGIGLVAGCGPAPDVEIDLAGRAASLAKLIADEQDHVSVGELADWLIKDQRDFELVDIREEAEFTHGHIESARHLPLAGLMSDASLATLPPDRKVVVYSNGTAHAAQAAVLLRLVGRDAYALLGGLNYWQAYLNDPDSAGVAQMDPAQRARYQAVACYFAGDYVAEAGLTVKGGVTVATAAPVTREDPLGLGLGLGLGAEGIRDAMAPQAHSHPPAARPTADPLGLGLGLGLGSDAVKGLNTPAPQPAPARKLLIKAEC